ncbi:MAG: hypothetical protein ACYTFM_00665 [Planctomycetota bacterium]|jgi:hypothetical protein
MKREIGKYFYACGNNQIPSKIELDGQGFSLNTILKHDFFAETALYTAEAKRPDQPAKLILKLNRQQHFFGIPLLWLGKILRDHEVEILHRLNPIEQVPHPISKYGPTGLIYEFIDGQTLEEKPKLSEDFFDQFVDLLHQVHEKSVIYLDMNKRSNIIIGSDSKPYLIDFQISLYLDPNPWIFKSLTKSIREALQNADFYHLFKHKRRLSPETLRPEEKSFSSSNLLIELHRYIANPFRSIRRKILDFLKTKGYLHSDNTSESH